MNTKEFINGKPYDYAGLYSEYVEIFELEIGNLVYVQGYIFRITDIKFFQPHNCNTEETIVRYIGKLVNVERNKSILGTHFDNSWYGHNDRCKAYRIKPEYQDNKVFNN